MLEGVVSCNTPFLKAIIIDYIFLTLNGNNGSLANPILPEANTITTELK